jgi:FHS family L-fucose permease-like MFS transporter
MEGTIEISDEENMRALGRPRPGPGSRPASYAASLRMLALLYFIFGFITCLNDILVPHLKRAFDLGYTRAMFIQLSFFSAYFLVSLPAGRLVDRIGCPRGMVGGLGTMAGGCLLFLPAAAARSYPLFLLALFLLAAGVTLLQVAANPYVAALGSPETSSSRLTLTQAFNSLGTTAAPLFGSALILARPGARGGAAGADAVRLPYLGLAAALAVLAVVTARFRLPPGAATGDAAGAVPFRPWRHRPLVLGALGIFLYVGAEVGIGSFLVNYLGQLGIEGLTLARAARYVSFYWGGAMAGRFLGSLFLRRVAPGRALVGHALAAAALVLTAMLAGGRASLAAILAVGLCNSIMFPTIFTLALRGLDHDLGRASGILCMAVVGGALVPVAQGALADWRGLPAAFALPLACYLFIAYYGAAGHLPARNRGGL